MINNRRQPKPVLPESAHALDRVIRRTGIPPSDRDQFLRWLIESSYSEFKHDRMNRRINTENEIKALGLHLPNGTVGKEYASEFQLPLGRISGVALDGADELGLNFAVDAEGNCHLTGIPTTQGDFTLTLRYATVEGEPESALTIPIAFNPNPRDLWVARPVPQNIPFWKDDEDCAYVCVEEFGGEAQKDIVAASKRGRSHAQDAKPRDDDFRVSFNPQNGWYVLAVADGAGSAKYSREGSRVACTIAEDYCKTYLAEQGERLEEAVAIYAEERSKEALQPVVEKVHEALFKAATEAYRAIVKRKDDSEGAVLKDFSTTLLLAICRKFSFGWFIASFGVGDGAIAIYDKDADNVRLLNEPDGGEFAGQTRFLTMESIFRDRTRIRMSIVPDFTALMLMTDGVSDPYFETDANLSRKEKWDALWESITSEVDLKDDNSEAATQLLSWLDFWSPGNHDDRTIAILY